MATVLISVAVCVLAFSRVKPSTTLTPPAEGQSATHQRLHRGVKGVSSDLAEVTLRLWTAIGCISAVQGSLWSKISTHNADIDQLRRGVLRLFADLAGLTSRVRTLFDSMSARVSALEVAIVSKNEIKSMVQDAVAAAKLETEQSLRQEFGKAIDRLQTLCEEQKAAAKSELDSLVPKIYENLATASYKIGDLEREHARLATTVRNRTAERTR